MSKRWKFVKKDPLQNPVLVTEYDIVEEFADRVLADLRRIDYLAIKIGWSWDKVPSEEAPVAVRPPATKEWTGPAMNHEPLAVNGVPSEQTYLRRMRKEGIDESEARRLKEIIDSL